MKEMFVWNDQFKIGNEKVDNQHQVMFKLANKAFNINYQDANKLIMELFKYTNFHFKSEEEYMESIKYKDLEKHKKIHEDLITELSKISKGGIKSDDNFIKLQSFIWQWLKKHIMEEDKKIKKTNLSLT
jgi:hemerythrin